MSDPVYIEDGYTKDGFLADIEGYGSLRFKYRPVVADEGFKLWSLFRNDISKYASEARKMLPRQLVEWDLQHGGKTLPISDATIGRLDWALFGRLANVVTGIVPSDDVPASKPGLVEAETDAKN